MLLLMTKSTLLLRPQVFITLYQKATVDVYNIIFLQFCKNHFLAIFQYSK